ncbi:MAG: hypothetical protein QG635_2419 [Bacteroidota bacterium]|nr:hypothetical protein [Bacteroidota bacterium]
MLGSKNRLMEALTLHQITSIVNSKTVLAFNNETGVRKLKALLALILIDELIIVSTMIFSFYLMDYYFAGGISLIRYKGAIAAAVILIPAIFLMAGLYPGIGIDAISEFKKIMIGTATIYFTYAGLSYFLHIGSVSSGLLILISWVLTLVTLPLGRAGFRKIISYSNWWGIPAVIIGSGEPAIKVIESLRKNRHIGLIPYIIIEEDSDKWGYIEGIPVVGGIDILPLIADKLKIEHAIIALDNTDILYRQNVISKCSENINNVIVMPDILSIRNFWASTFFLNGIFGLNLQKNLLYRHSMLLKRLIDILVTSLLIILSLPLFIIIPICILIDSKGRIFFKQERVGKDKKPFFIYKFRTMHHNAEEKLRHILLQDDSLRNEYSQFHKLRNDPRLTRVGRLLRKLSLDELPQFFNVIRGEMSLIGPRPYLEWELYKLEGAVDTILKVKPGVTGLWQVTIRNESSFEDRGLVDVYYIRNWSLFLDFYIIARTAFTMIKGKGE